MNAMNGQELQDYTQMQTETQTAPRFNLAGMVMNGNSKAMEKKMKDDVFILKDIALMGQSTVIYAAPNAGKTLITLSLVIDAAKSGVIPPENIFYVNSDDTYRGFVAKLKLAEKYGFGMLCPDENGFRNRDLPAILEELIERDEAKDKVFILDTLKKFADLMDKKRGSGFMNIVRRFTAKGGTVIALAHVNKHQENGKSVHAGTTDVKDDSDSVFIIDVEVDIPSERVVVFKCEKSRGDIPAKVSFSYDPSLKHNYYELLDSVKRVDGDDLSSRIKKDKTSKFIAENIDIVNHIKELIYSGTVVQKEILKAVREKHDVSAGKARNVLIKLTGKGPHDDCLWWRKTGEKHSYIYGLKH